jgi:hypothetical protein
MSLYFILEEFVLVFKQNKEEKDDSDYYNCSIIMPYKFKMFDKDLIVNPINKFNNA